MANRAASIRRKAQAISKMMTDQLFGPFGPSLAADSLGLLDIPKLVPKFCQTRPTLSKALAQFASGRVITVFLP